jgi:hypothetical protein
MVLEVSAYDQFALLLWARGGSSWRECVVEQNYSLHDQEAKERGRKGLKSHNPLQGHASDELKFLPPPNSSAGWGPNL